MKTLKPLLFALSLSAASLTQAITPVSPHLDPYSQVAGFYHHEFGKMRITALLDGSNYLKPELFKGLTDTQKQDILKKYYVDTSTGIQTSVNAFVLNTRDKIYLIDSGAASCFGTHLGSIYNNLQASGYAASHIDGVILTHLHPDHSCGISNNGVANYPKATLHISKTEYDYWLSPDTLKKIPQANREKFLATVEKIKAALAPYQQANKIQLFSDKALKLGELQLIPSFGHTPGHYSFKVTSDGKDMVFIGDIVHSHTLQFDQPKTAVEFDIDPKAAVETRLKHFAEYAKQGQLIAAPHLPFPGLGHIYSKDGNSYQWMPIHFNPKTF